MRRASVIEPTAFEASVNATICVRSDSSASSASRSSVPSSGRTGTVCTVSA